MKNGHNRDIVVIGASAGGVEALSRLVEAIPPDIPAALFVVLHMAAHTPSVLHTLLQHHTDLEVRLAEEGEPIRPGVLCAARPDHHLLLKSGRIHLTRGPRENFSRPAIDPLFRSAAAEFGSRVIGVILTGLLDDGSAGLRDVRRCGGMGVVQDPDDAAYPEMPQSAKDASDPEWTMPLSQIGDLLDRLTRQSAPNSSERRVPEDILCEIRFAEGGLMLCENRAESAVAPVVCLECGGSLFETLEGSVRHYRCRVGHGYSDRGLLSSHINNVENDLWTAVRSIEEQKCILHRLTQHARKAGRHNEAKLYEQSLAGLQRREAQIRSLVLDKETFGIVNE